MRYTNLLTAMLMLTIGTSALFSQQTQTPSFKRIEIGTENRIQDSFFYDINGDGLKDLFITSGEVKKMEERRLQLHLQTAAGFSNTPDQLLLFPESAVVYDIGTLPSIEKAPLILYIGPDGLSYQRFNTSGFEKAVVKLKALDTIYQVPPRDAPIRAKLFHRETDGTTTRLCIPSYTKLYIIDPSKAEDIQAPKSVSLPVMTTMGTAEEMSSENYDPVTLSQRLLIRVPKIFFKTFDADNIRDLVSVVKDRITVFRGKNNGRFESAPFFNTTLNLSAGESSGLIRPNFKVHIADANGDTRQDILVTKASMKTQNSSTKVYLFMNKGGKIPDSPDQVILFANTVGNNIDFMDLNRDGSVDLVIPSANMSLFQFLKILISQKFNYTKNIHLWQKEGFKKSPDIKLAAEARFNLENPEDLQGAFYYMEGDVNGDGLTDLVKSDSDRGKISIRMGLAGNGLFSNNATLSLNEKKIPTEIHFEDLNNDKCDEMIYREGIRSARKLVIWLTSK